MPECDASERNAILAEFDRLTKRGLPRNLTGYGCLLFILGGGMFAALPVFLADQAQSQDSKIFLTVVIIALIVIGIWFTVRGNQKKRFIQVQVNAALAELRQFPALAPEDRRATAIRLLLSIPKSDWEWRVEKLRAEIPDALPYVLAVREVVENRPGRNASNGGRAGSQSPS